MNRAATPIDTITDLYAELTIARACIAAPKSILRLRAILNRSDFSDAACGWIWELTAQSGGDIPERWSIPQLVANMPPAAAVDLRRYCDSDDLASCLEVALSDPAGRVSEAAWCCWRVQVAALKRRTLALTRKIAECTVEGRLNEGGSLLSEVDVVWNQLVAAQASADRELAELRGST